MVAEKTRQAVGTRQRADGESPGVTGPIAAVVIRLATLDGVKATTSRGRLIWAVLMALGAAAAGPGWRAVPLTTEAQRAGGVVVGGEGGQWPRGPVATSAADPGLLLLPIDVGGVYRSTDGGRRWAISMTGWNARGANGFAIDPADADRVLGVGGNSMAWDARWGPSPNGVYRSVDRGAYLGRRCWPGPTAWAGVWRGIRSVTGGGLFISTTAGTCFGPTTAG